MSSTEVVTHIERLNSAFEAFKAANDDRLKQLESRQSADILTTEKVDRINAEITKSMQAIDELNVKLAQLRLQPGNDVSQTPERAAYRAAFGNYMRTGHGKDDLKQLAIKAAMTVQSDPSGGFLAPTELDSAIGRVQATVSGMRGLATVRTISGHSYSKLFNTGGTGSGWAKEGGVRPETATPTLSEMEFPAMELYAMPSATQTLLDDAVVDIEQWLAEEVMTTFGEQEGAAFVTGNGVGKPFGFTAVPTVADASWAWGKLGLIKTGANGAFAASNPGDNIITLIYQLKQSYRVNGTLIMNRKTQAEVRKFKDSTGQYLWQPNNQAGAPATYAGYPIVDDDNMPDMATGSFSVAFGDFRAGYLIVDRTGVRVLRDPFTAKPYVLFYTTKRVGGGVQNYEAIKLLQFAA